MARTTIKQVAQMAGVSPTAVSLAINGKPGISEQTRARIIEIVKQMDFTPNESSRRLLFNRTGNIAVLMDQDSSLLDQSFYSELNTQLIRECEDRHYNLIYCVSRMEADHTVTIPKVIRSRDVDGIIVLGYLDQQIISKISSCDCPIIILDNYIPSSGVGHVVFDYQAASVMAMEYLISKGHRQIGYIGSDISGGKIQFFSQQTFKGYRQVLEQYHLAIPASWMQMSAQDEKTAGDSMDKILQSDVFPTAVLCSGDIYAIGAMRSIKQHGLRIPDDISLIGIDDIILSRYVEPALSTIRVDRKNMAAMAVEALVGWIEESKPEEQLVCAKLQMIERDSVKILSSTGL